MADCTKTVDFLREWQRLCKPQKSCFDCPVCLHGDCRVQGVHAIDDVIGAIAIVQKWSDEHPAMTWKGKLRELLRHADVDTVTKACCPGAFFGGAPTKLERTFCPYLSDGCAKCWNGEYKEAASDGG